MRDFISLLKASMNSYYNISYMRDKYIKKKKGLWEPVVILISMGIFVLVYGFLFIKLLNLMYKIGASIGQPNYMIATVIVFCQVITLIFGFLWTISLFYFSDDLKFLISLPIKSYKILMSKFAIILFNEYITTGILFIPTIIVYGINGSKGFIFYIMSIVTLLFLPLIPLAVSSIITIFVMKFVNIKGKKDLYTVIISSLIIIVAILIQLFAGNIPKGHEAQYINSILISNYNLIKAITVKFPPSLWATLGLSGGIRGMLYFILFIISSLIMLAVLYYVTENFYLKSLLSGSEIIKRNKAKDSNIKDIKEYKRSPFNALLQKEWKLFIRVPVYAINVIPIAIIIPVVFIPLFKLEDASNPVFMLSHINGIGFYIALGITAFAAFITSTVSLSSTSISREGKLFYISRLLPVEPMIQMNAKLFLGIMMSLFSFIPTLVILIIYLKISIIYILLIISLSVLSAIAINIGGLIIDILRPLLIWDNPQKAMKSNLNVLFQMILSWIFIAIIFGAFAYLKYLHFPEIILSIGLLFLLVIINVLIYKLLTKTAAHLFKRTDI